MTWDHLPETPSVINERQSELAELHAGVFAPPPAKPSPNGSRQPQRGNAQDATGGEGDGRAEPGGDGQDAEDDAVLRRALSAKNGAKFAALWRGDTSEHGGDDSAADLALCNLLAFYCGPGPEGHARVDRLFRRSGLMRPKWDEKHGKRTYGAMTIDKAYEGRDEFYRASSASPEIAPLPFPVETLPPTFRALVLEGAASIGTPPDFVALPLLVTAGAAMGGAVEIELKAGWREGPNLIVAIVGETGTGKTPAEQLGEAPIQQVQSRLEREYRDQRARYGERRDLWEAAAKNATTMATRGPRPTRPTFKHVLTSDATTEALAPMLQAGHGVALTMDELTRWVRGMDQYRSGGKGADRQHYLSMWSRVPIKVDRKGAREPIIVERPCLSVVGGIQPDLLPNLADSAKQGDGFLDRVLFGYPETTPIRWSDQGVCAETQGRVYAVFERLYTLGPVVTGDGEVFSLDEARPRVFPLSAEAGLLWKAWFDGHATEQEDEAFPSHLRGPWAKMPAQLARLALILHVCGHACSDPMPADMPAEISERTLAAAADLVDYFKNHARRVYQRIRRERRPLALRVLGALKERGPMNRRQLLHDVFKRNVSAAALSEALDELEECGLAAHGFVSGAETGGRPGTVWGAL